MLQPNGISMFAVILAIACSNAAFAQPLRIQLSTVVQGDEQWDWTQARTADIPGNAPLSVTTISRTAKIGSHGYHDVFLTSSRDHGQTWSVPNVIPTLKRVRSESGYEVVAGDLWPKFHVGTRTILITGKTFNFANGTKENYLREQVSYAVLDPQLLKCGPLKTIEMPKLDHADCPIFAPNAGCHQRFDLPNGDILLPIRYQKEKNRRVYTTIVVHCRFDGVTLKYVEHGSEHNIPTGRGLYEPSVTEFKGQFFLTMRADDNAYVAKSDDGINYASHNPWTFDDGESLGSYNTQQHWVGLGGKLYLIYTRRGNMNDHIMRHRAPLFIAEVDADKLQVIRSTEQILVPENHATLGNSGVCIINANEAWITVAEGRVSHGQRKGENNKVVLAKVVAE